MSKLSELLAAAKANRQQLAAQTIPVQTVITESLQAIGNPEHHYGVGLHGESIEYNAEQWKFIQLVLSGKSCVLIGAAGCGKTTSTRGAMESLLQTKHIPPIGEPHKHLDANSPAIVFISYTRRAVMNLRKAVPPELASNCITIHKLLEYAPVFYEVFDDVSGEYKKTMKFEPSRNRYNPLPPTIRTIIIDESSMVSVALYAQILDALGENKHNVQFIFLGDIQQLPPVFGSAILGYKMLSLPVIELTQVYRQALESPIIRLAHRILSGVPIPLAEMKDWNDPGKLKLHPWKKKIGAENALLTMAAFFKQGYDTNAYNPEEDMILIPFNKACGTDELNKHIANHIARRNHRVTYEVIAGYNKHYFSEGDKVLYEKEDAIIVGIKRNPVYSGNWPQSASHLLDYWGCLQLNEAEEISHESEINETETDEDIDKMLELMGSDVEDRVREASHILTIRMLDSDRELEIKTAADINNLIMSYALTVHKSQGSEWKRVFLMLHQSHNTMIQRELLYTGCTRAREELYVICESDSFEKGIRGQRIKGNTLAEKATFFRGKLDAGEESLLSIVS